MSQIYGRVKQELDGMQNVPVLVEGDGFALYQFQQGHEVLIVEHRDFIDFAPIHQALKESGGGILEAALVGGQKAARKEIKKARPKGLFASHKYLWAHLSDEMKVWNSGTQLGPSLVKVLKSVAKGAPVGSAPQPKPIGKIATGALLVGLILFWLFRWFLRVSF